jgi:hypothetical protein
MITWQPGMSLEALEKSAIFEAMKFFQNNKAATARALGIAPRTLDNKLEKYAAEDKERVSFDDEQRKERESFLQRQRHGALADTGGVASQDQISRQHERPARESQISNGASKGLDAQSVAQVPAQQNVSVSQREEVQGVLPKNTSKVGNNGRR